MDSVNARGTIPLLSALALLLLHPGAATAGWQQYGPADGLPGGDVTAMIEDRSGGLWIATEGGGVGHTLGLAWETFTVADGLGSNQCLAIREDRSGAIWVGSADGVSRFDGSRWETFRPGPTPFRVDILAEDPSGGMVVGTIFESILYRYDGASWTPIQAPFVVHSVLFDRQGTLWAGGSGTGHDVASFDGTRWIPAPISPSGPVALLQGRNGIWALGFGVTFFDGAGWTNYGLHTGRVVCALETSRGELWISDLERAARYDGNSWSEFQSSDLPTDPGSGAPMFVNSILEDALGSVWLIDSSHRYIGIYDGERFRTMTAREGLPLLNSRSFRDTSGNVWLGIGAGSGLARFDGSLWRSFTAQDGAANRDAIPWAESPRGTIWCTSWGAGVLRYDGQRWTRFAKGDGLVSDSLGVLAVDHQGNVWVSGWSAQGPQGGVNRFDGIEWTTFTTSDGLVDDRVNDIRVGPSGTVWFSTWNGISGFHDGEWRNFTIADGLPGEYVRTVFETRSGELWTATDSHGLYRGISHFDGSRWTTYPPGGPDDIGGFMLPRYSMMEDLAGRFWTISRRGIVRFNGAGWDSFPVADLGADGLITSILEDRQGNLWAGVFDYGNPSVARFDGAAWATFRGGDGVGLDFSAPTLQDSTGNVWVGGQAFAQNHPVLTRYDGERWRSYSLGEGPPVEYSDAFSMAMLEDHRGALWIFSPALGVTRYEPDRTSPQTVFVTRPPTISSSQSHNASFLAAFGETRGTEFSTRLDQGSWSGWAPVGAWSGGGLGDGMHVLEARCRDFDGNVDPTPAVARFEIDATPPAPILTSPTFGSPVRGTSSIVGTAADPRFASYRVEVRPSGGTSWNGASLLNMSTIPVANGPLASWDTRSLGDGLYDLRLTVTDSLGLFGATQITVLVDNEFPFADQTAPGVISASSGGNLYSNDAALHLFFPPHAFPGDALVSLSASSGPADTLASGAVQASPLFLVSWSGELRKAAAAEFAAPAGSGPVAVYHATGGGAWHRLGGTRSDGALSLPITEPGTYALFTDDVPSAPGAPSLASLSFTPRVFSPTGGFAQSTLAIGFTLGRASPVTVRVYSRSGRLVREVVSGQSLGQGANLVRWDGRDRNGGVVPDGMYVVTVEALGTSQTKTLAVVR